jgi:hypothetical protein
VCWVTDCAAVYSIVCTKLLSIFKSSVVACVWISVVCAESLMLTLNHLAFQSFDFERTWWWLFQKRVVRTFDIYVLIIIKCTYWMKYPNVNTYKPLDVVFCGSCFMVVIWTLCIKLPSIFRSSVVVCFWGFSCFYCMIYMLTDLINHCTVVADLLSNVNINRPVGVVWSGCGCIIVDLINKR